MFAKRPTPTRSTPAPSAPGGQFGRATPRRLPETDLAYARAVAADALARGGKDASIPWENPHTGAGGNITPLAAAYNEGAFPAAISWRAMCTGHRRPGLQGEACRTEHGMWEVKSLKPLKQG